MHWNRRDFLRAGGLTAFGLGLNLTAPVLLRRSLLAASPGDDTKLVFIFQRGGNDAVNTVIPYGDSEYNTKPSPTLFIHEAGSRKQGNGLSGLNPRLGPMMEIYNRQDLNGQPGPGNLAVIHRVGYSKQSQSHFDGQQYWENGVPGDPSFEEGMMYRQVALTMNPTENRLAAAALSGSQMVSLKGPLPMATLNAPARFPFSGSAAKVQKFIGNLPTLEGGPDGSGLLGAYGGPRDHLGKNYRDLVYNTGLALTDAMSIVQEAMAQGRYEPSGGAVYPNGRFGQHCADAAMLMKRTPIRVLGINIGGWDNHTNQGQIYGRQGELLAQVAQGFQALYRDLQDQWDKLIIVTLTEFGRTSRENGSAGTDHGKACVMFVAGGAVRGGVYNCDSTTWADGDMFSSRDRYVDRKTDYRAVLGEIFMNHFGNDRALLDMVIPGYSEAALAYPSDFRLLSFLA